MRTRNWLGSVIHNCIAHPLMPFLPRVWGDKFHDWTIEKFWPPLDGDDENR